MVHPNQTHSWNLKESDEPGPLITELVIDNLRDDDDYIFSNDDSSVASTEES